MGILNEKRCKSNNLLSDMNCFSGMYISFNAVIDIISNNFKNLENNIVKFKICDLGNKDNDGIVFARCYDYTDDIIRMKPILV